jgi:hypothetical protein
MRKLHRSPAFALLLCATGFLSAADAIQLFPDYGRVEGANPNLTHNETFSIPSRLIVRCDATHAWAKPDVSSRENVTLPIGQKMILGLHAVNELRPQGRPTVLLGEGRSSMGEGRSGEVHSVSLDEVHSVRPNSSRQVIMRAEIFETDMPPQHLWQPQGPKYRVLWQKEFVVQCPVVR